MSSSDEDYMSPEILGKLKDTGSDLPRKHQRDIMVYKKTKRENFKNSRVGKKILEEERQKELMETKISSDNIGFKMLEKMGYKPGTSLGTRGSKITSYQNKD
ncbi:G patch domain-containing protein 11 [Thelohanellus kitauei]|uniref:G patch domain-containing protein 11 n=1 Tax=Thelohanellus kitauei TaxID=669202 RepID=A0A0C2IFY7_THEKT|nr:G patch domain-containing protein 11 [Thelohanellus kitauei]